MTDRERLARALLDGTAEARPVSELGLRGRRGYYRLGDAVGVLVDRKSRFVTRDAAAALDVFAAAARPRDGVVVVRTAPVCSKARALLEGEGVLVVSAPVRST